MANLKQISEEIAGALNRPYDAQFKARIRAIFKHEAATVIKQQLDKGGNTEQFIGTYHLKLEVITDMYNPCSNSNKMFGTTEDIVKPIRYNTDDPFSFIGKPDGTVVYIYSRLTELPYADLQPAYKGSPIRYIYRNDRLYFPNMEDVDNPTGEECVGITAPFPMGSIIGKRPNDIKDSILFNDDQELPFAEDLIQIIKLKLLQGELSVTDSKDKITPEHMDNM